MSYSYAKAAFADALKHLDKRNDPVMHNLLTGLHHLAEQLERDVRRISGKVDEISHDVYDLRRR